MAEGLKILNTRPIFFKRILGGKYRLGREGCTPRKDVELRAARLAADTWRVSLVQTFVQSAAAARKRPQHCVSSPSEG